MVVEPSRQTAEAHLEGAATASAVAAPSAGAAQLGQLPAAPARMAVFDVARFIAAAGIVWLHTVESPTLGPTAEIGRFGVPFFAMGAVFFLMEGLRRQPQRRFGKYAVGRFVRIYVPFLAWTAAYILMRDLKHRLLSGQAPVKVEVALLWTGSAHHLWFLPFILAICLILWPVAKLIALRPSTEWVVGLIAAIGGLAVALGPQPAEVLWSPKLEPVRYLVEQSWLTMPAVLWGLAVVAIYRRVPGQAVRSTPIAVLGLALAAACSLWLCLRGRSMGIESLAGVGLLFFALAPWSGRWANRGGQLGKLALGIYLAHIGFVEAFQAIAIKAGMRSAWLLDLSIFALALAISALLTALLGKSRCTRWLVGL